MCGQTLEKFGEDRATVPRAECCHDAVRSAARSMIVRAITINFACSKPFHPIESSRSYDPKPLSWPLFKCWARLYEIQRRGITRSLYINNSSGSRGDYKSGHILSRTARPSKIGFDTKWTSCIPSDFVVFMKGSHADSYSARTWRFTCYRGSTMEAKTHIQ